MSAAFLYFYVYFKLEWYLLARWLQGRRHLEGKKLDTKKIIIQNGNKDFENFWKRRILGIERNDSERQKKPLDFINISLKENPFPYSQARPPPHWQHA